MDLTINNFDYTVKNMSEDELKREIEQHDKSAMKHVSDEEKAAYEAEKKKRAEELEKLKEKLKAEGKWEE
ncbi:hypothetical protein NEF87_002417 [Candidatus Lokiarchaeum ossiferum]|uniref:Phage protein n=2 Tax=Candidatus Lokiarchaeum ossiferum TaxID=2951803 RepID=A0ABY6HUU8_9ARCH|nr:hypothetical protein NEF87_002417 [Candidatus Lokiarchaeum sp. B-35]